MTYDIVPCDFIVFKKYYTPSEDVHLQFESIEAANAFMEWWRRQGGNEAFAQWCLDQGWDNLVDTSMNEELETYEKNFGSGS